MSQSSQVNTKPALGLAEFVVLMALITSLVALAMDAMLPALPQIAEDLNAASAQQSQLIIPMLILGMAFGQLFFGVLSDARGRKFAIQSGLVVFALGSLVCMFATDMTTMLLGRVVQGFGVSGPRIASMALIRDQYAGAAMARVMSFATMIFVLVPMVAPAIGQGLLVFFSWHSIFALFLVMGAIVALWLGIRQPETLPVHKRRPFNMGNFIEVSKYVLTHKEVMGYTLAAGCIFGPFLAYLSTSQYIFQDIYQQGDLFPVYFAILATGIGIASFVNAKLVMTLGMLRISLAGLAGLILLSLLLTAIAGFFQGVPPLWIFVPLLLSMFFCVGILFGNINALAMEPLGEMAGQGAAILGSMTNVVAVPLSIYIVNQLATDIFPISLAFAACGFLALLAVRWSRYHRELQQQTSQEPS